jgi:catechol 2,3-dioxygenase-like lactoylglutathione lyase family enzyme
MSGAALESEGRFRVVGLGYVSLYYRDFDEAVAFYTRVFGTPLEADDPGVIRGWHLGSIWLTLFPSKGGTKPDANPCNTEFAIQVSTPEEVDVLLQVMIDAGATLCWAAEDTEMYDPMRFGYVEDPFGVRIDVYCPLVAGEPE